MEMDKSGMRLFRVYHDKDLLSSYPIPDDGIRVPYYTGDKELGKMLSEYQCLIDPDIDLDGVEYAGLEHYRRTFDIITPENAQEYANQLIGNRCWRFNAIRPNLKQPWMHVLSLQRYDTVVRNYIYKTTGKSGYFLWNKNQYRFGRGMYIMRIEWFNQYIEFVKGLVNALLEFDGISESHDLSVPVQKTIDDLISRKMNPELFLKNVASRMYGFIIEMAVDIWVQVKMRSIGEIGHMIMSVDTVNADSPQEFQEYTPSDTSTHTD